MIIVIIIIIKQNFGTPLEKIVKRLLLFYLKTKLSEVQLELEVKLRHITGILPLNKSLYNRFLRALRRWRRKTEVFWLSLDGLGCSAPKKKKL